MDILDNISNEDYVIQRAKLALKSDPLSAKAWMLTARTLYPNNFGVQVTFSEHHPRHMLVKLPLLFAV